MRPDIHDQLRFEMGRAMMHIAIWDEKLDIVPKAESYPST